jgi:hypothetical protein
MDATTSHQDDETEQAAGDLLIGGQAIRLFLISLGFSSDVDVYYMRRCGRWPIGNDGAKLVASKKRLNRYAERISAPTTK